MQNWKHYLSEFILLFVAVTLGFLTDNWRDRLQQRKQEKYYIHSLAEDLGGDLKAYVALKSHLQERVESLDSALIFLNVADPDLKSVKFHKIVFNAVFFVSPLGFRPADATVKLLENDGFKVIRNRSIIDSVLLYYGYNVDRLKTHYDIMIAENMELVHSLQSLTDFRVFDEFWDPELDTFNENPPSPVRTLPNDALRLYIFRNQLQDQKKMTKRVIHHINRNIKAAGKFRNYFLMESSK